MKELKINPIDFYNQTEKDEALELFLNKNKSVEKLSKDNYGCVQNTGDKTVQFHQNSIYLEVVEDNPIMGFSKGLRISPFELLVRYKFDNNIYKALNFLETKYNQTNMPYIRVAGEYFKKVIKTDRDKVKREELIRWKKETLLDDYGKEMIKDIKKYDGFCLEPDNRNFQQSVDGFYNKYAPFAHKSKKFDVKNDLDKIKWSIIMMKHIFGDQIDMGWTYMQVMYLHPRQILPILGLVSQLRGTGKTTYGDWMLAIYGDNGVLLNPSNISSSFNSTYATKNLLIIEETKFEKSGDLEKLKAISTQKKMTVNTKYISEYSIPFFGKIIMFSNHEDKFVIMDDEEIRYWVRQIPKIEIENHNILKDIIKEIPYFLYFLEQMPNANLDLSRMVFTADQLETKILTKTKENSRSAVHKSILELLDKYCMDNNDIEVIRFTNIDIHEKWFSKGKYDLSYISKVIKYEMKLDKESKVVRYRTLDNIHNTMDGRGRPYEFKNEYYKAHDVINEDDDDGLPF